MEINNPEIINVEEATSNTVIANTEIILEDVTNQNNMFHDIHANWFEEPIGKYSFFLLTFNYNKIYILFILEIIDEEGDTSSSTINSLPNSNNGKFLNICTEKLQ